MHNREVLGQKKVLGVLIVPCFNEFERLPINYFKQLAKKIEKLGFNLLFVNDGSTDFTLQLLETNLHDYANIINLKKNLGKSEAIRQGMIESYTRFPNLIYIGFLDADGAFGINDIIYAVKKIQKLPKINMLFGARIKLAGMDIRRKISRHILGRVVTTFINTKWSLKIYDPQTGFKILRSNIIEKSDLQRPFRTRWFVDMELLLRIDKSKLLIQEIPVTLWRDVPGSKLKIRHCPRIVCELTYIKYLQILYTFTK